MRGPAMGRKNWLCAGPDEGAERAARLCTVLESAARHDVATTGPRASWSSRSNPLGITNLAAEAAMIGQQAEGAAA